MATERQRRTLIHERLAAAYPEARCALDHGGAFQLLVATVLSAQCTDARVNLTTPGLFARWPDPAALASADLAEVEAVVRPTGFYRNKARNLVALSAALLTRHGGEVPGDLEALAALPGVGRKTANVVLSNAFRIPALPVDTHIFRVARRLGLSRGTGPDQVEADLCRAFPRASWIDLHHQLIFHGRRVCEARTPRCPDCPLADLCPTGRGTLPDPHTGRPVAARAADAALPPTLQAAAGAPRRIVSLVPSFTELLVQWGLAHRIVGRTRFCTSPSWIRASIPAVGGTKDPDLEAVRALAPDLVLMERDENRLEDARALEALGLKVLALSVRDLAGAAGALRTLGTVLGAEEGEAAARRLEAILDRPAPEGGPGTLVLVWRGPWIAAGPGTYLADLARRAGLRPLGPEGYPRLSDADLEALAPDLVVLPTEPYRFNARHRAELARRLPGARVVVAEGQDLTWMLSRTERGLALLEDLAKGD